MFAAGMRHCVIDPDSDMSVEELAKLFVKLGCTVDEQLDG